MNNLLNNKKLKFNSKKGFTLIELIVAVMILLIVIGASVRGISISYRSAMLGAEKNDAQSVAQRNCDIIMSAIVTNVEKKTFSDFDTLDGMVTHTGNGFTNTSPNTYASWISNDADMYLPDGGYDKNQYLPLQQILSNGDKRSDVENYKKNVDEILYPDKKYQYFTLSRTENKIGTSTYQVYKITTYVYYTNKAYVTCEGEVSVIPK